MEFKSLATAVAAAAFLVSGAGAALAGGVAKGDLAPNAWPQAYSDLKPDAQVRFGTLPNGMTYALMRNATPVGEASLRLRIAAGSLMESEGQRGLAHFLEHMAFNGSTHVPTGEMVKILERHGLAFGADTNASTSWSETVYKLDLPKTDTDTVDTGLMLLREIAGELQIPQAAMDRERGVVLSEERLDDNPNYRAFENRLKFLLPGQRAAERMPIGKVEVVRTAPRAAIEDFYEKYYRPERATLVAVGDFDLDAMEAKIRARFGGWTNSHTAGTDVDLGSPTARRSEAKLIVEPGAPLSIQLSWTAAADLSAESEAHDRYDALEDLALSVLNRRLERIGRSATAPFISASASDGDLFNSAKLTTLQVTAEQGGWKAALAAAEHEERRLVEYGVLRSELDREIDDARATLVERAAGAATRSTRSLADLIVESVGDRSVVQSPAQELAQFEREVKTITPEEVSAAAKRVFTGSGPLVFMTTPAPIGGGDSVLKAAYVAAQAEPVLAPTVVADKSWPYERFGQPGKVVERRDISEFGAVMVRFANGVRLTVKPTKFSNSEVEVQVRFGHGRLDLSRSSPSPLWAANSFIEGGLKQLTAEDIDQTLNKKVIGARFGADDEGFTLSGGAKSSDLDTQMQLLTAYVVEPGFRPEAFERVRAYGMTLNEQMEATPSGVLNRDLARLLHSDDLRWATPTSDEIAASHMDDLKTILSDHLNHGPIEVVIVGDVDVNQAVAATAATLGALRRDPSPDAPTPDSRVVTFPKTAPEPVIERHKGRADQAVAALAWPTNDFYADMREARVLTVLGQVMQLRMIDDLRVQKGDTYSPSAGLDASLAFPGYGYLLANVETPPGKIDAFFAEADKIVGDLRSQPVSQDELTRAVLPLLDQLTQARESNDYWIAALTEAQTDPRRLQSVRSQIAQYRSVTAADLQVAAQKYLKPGKAWKLEVLPEPTITQAALAPNAAIATK